MSTEMELAGQSAGLAPYNVAMFPELREIDPKVSEARFLNRFAKAKTLDELFDVMEGNSASNMVGAVVEIQSVEWAPYQSDDGIIPNAICQAVDTGTGEVIEFATTSKACTHFIRQAELVGAMPFRATIAQVLTRSGRKALNLERPHQLGDRPRRTIIADVVDEGAA